MLKNKELFSESLERSVNWLLRQINPDGTVNPVAKGAIAYYKLPWALVLAGKSLEAARIIRWIIKETMTADGDLQSDKRQKFHLDYYTYPNAWICLASHLLSLFDISYKTWNHISSFQDPKTGGYCSRSPYNPNKDNLQDAISTAWCSVVGLHLGRVEEAKKAAKFLEMLLSLQPDFDKQFFYYWYPKEGLVVEKPPEEPDDRFIRINVTDQEENFYYILGASISFLAQLYAITKDKRHLELAKTYYEFVMRGPESLFHTESAGKLCYASTHLYHASGERKYLDMAGKFMVSLLEIGEKDGSWIRGGKPTSSSTAEFCVWRSNLLSIGEG